MKEAGSWRKTGLNWVFRVMLLTMGVGIGVLAQPSLIKDSNKRAQVEQVREQVLKANTQGQEKALQVLGESAETGKEVVEKVREVTRVVIKQDPQEIVNTTVNNITNEVKNLPQEQVKKIKLQVCQEILKDSE